MVFQDYRIASGHSVALASLNQIENQLFQQNRRVSGGKLYRVGIRSSILNLHSVRQVALSGKERRSGFGVVVWEMTLAVYGLKFWMDTYLSETVSMPVTIYTRKHQAASFVRCNALAHPLDPDGDIEYLRQGVFRVRQRFGDVTAL